MNPSLVLGFSIAWSLRTSIKLHVKTFKTEKIFFGFTQKFSVGMWAFVATCRRILSIICFFTPSLGLFNILHHWQAEQIPFSIRKKYNLIHPKDQVYLYNLNDTIFWKDLERWNYYEDPNEPTPPSYSVYTGLTLKWTFVTFLMFFILHNIVMAIVKQLTSSDFKNEENQFNKLVHVIQNTNFSFPHKDWDCNDAESKTIDGFKERFRNTEKEMIFSLLLNSFVSVAMLGPIWFTGKYYYFHPS